jgi:hypothetical protein
MNNNKPTCQIDLDGSKRWCLNGQLHRKDGPAVEYTDGTKIWYLNGVPHREDGPAYEGLNGTKRWWLNDVKFTEESYWQELFKRGLITEKELFLKLL